MAARVARLAPIPTHEAAWGPSSEARAGSCGQLVGKVLNKQKRRLGDIPVRAA
ncbi:hypothetical protein DFR24_4573 [Panacagrimonas perspica]|uniref:Uncharacterized protein n=1 Tax=Panacagrimonas perspica TaxID=381431 RepID=A0A4R7NTL2_9GAMM|nr:hypothetical protein [Panacagrimonas perspica]TDU24307.1 hypothetical protein DFR24_4573 [Panacagrimonas perspica]